MIDGHTGVLLRRDMYLPAFPPSAEAIRRRRRTFLGNARGHLENNRFGHGKKLSLTLHGIASEIGQVHFYMNYAGLNDRMLQVRVLAVVAG